MFQGENRTMTRLDVITNINDMYIKYIKFCNGIVFFNILVDTYRKEFDSKYCYLYQIYTY